MGLHNRLVRLAHAKPEFRIHLVPLLKKARGRDKWDQVITGPRMRFRQGYDTILIEEMPGKPVKRRVRRMRFSLGDVTRAQWFHGVSQQLSGDNVAADARISPGMTYDRAVAAMWSAIDEALEKMKSESVKLNAKWPTNYGVVTDDQIKRYGLPKALGYETEVSYLEIEPANYKPIEFSGKDFGGTSKWHEFTFYDAGDRDDYMAQMEGMRAFYNSKSKGAARKLFKFLKADPDRVRNMTVAQFRDMLKKGKIGYRYVPTVWR